MKLLLDANLSWKLVAAARRWFPGSEHVVAAGLGGATDRDIWEYAKSNGFAILSKDTDFRQLSFLYGAPPKVIWLNIGNRPTSEIAAMLEQQHGAVQRFDDSAEALLVIAAAERL